jgi:hypothetical protein
VSSRLLGRDLGPGLHHALFILGGELIGKLHEHLIGE